ncbi:type I restriction-modification system subunit M [Dubosiella newyorkensis]|uniref:site-specific DNA-methyltransferase (adenine-specific) n=1 Tax=Dubosiella newyorkensis TaxID=1862672 RepID=A0A1U7NM27_9FIRM|nr:type I restriction-modification system subunit M [Dubosiella newyorkensis]OLU46186.1 type I restriction-modification system subunit M [Dubosiella newyorkensis]
MSEKRKLDEIKSSLWEMANKLRGTMDASEYKNYILAFMFYRYLSEKQMNYLVDQDLIIVEPGMTVNEAYAKDANNEENRKDFLEELTSALGYGIMPENTWQSLIDKINNSKVIPSDYQKIFDEFNASTKMNKEAEIDFYGVFSDVNLGDSRLGTTTVDRAKSLNKIVNLVNDIAYKDDSGKDVLGSIYEYLIQQFAASAGKKGGEFYTPHEVSIVMAKIVTEDKEAEKQAFTVYDPTCGSGSLLLTVGDELKGGHKPGAIQYYGQEMNTTTYNLARMNLMMHGVNYQNMHISNANTLGRDWPDGPDAKGIDHPRSFDAVVANPPYSAKWEPTESTIKDPRYKDYGRTAPKSKADYAFLLHGLFHLNSEGTMAIVLPHGVLFRGAAEGMIRENLIKKNLIDTIIGLPANLFYGTSIPTIIMVLKRNKKTRDVFFIDASNEYEKIKNKNILTKENIEKIYQTYKNREDIDKYSHVATYAEIESNDYNLNIPRYVDTSEPEEEIDLEAVIREISKDDEEIQKLQKEINEQLKMLGLTPIQ